MVFAFDERWFTQERRYILSFRQKPLPTPVIPVEGADVVLPHQTTTTGMAPGDHQPSGNCKVTHWEEEHEYHCSLLDGHDLPLVEGKTSRKHSSSDGFEWETNY